MRNKRNVFLHSVSLFLSFMLLSYIAAPAGAQNRIVNLLLKNGSRIENVELLHEEESRIQFRKGGGKAWLSREEIESIEFVRETAPRQTADSKAKWLTLWQPDDEDFSNVERVTEEGQEWNRISTQYFLLHYKDGADLKKVGKLACLLDNVYRFLNERTERDAAYPVKVFLFPEFIGGRCDFEKVSIYMYERSDLDSLVSLCMHEATHLFNAGKRQNWWSGEFMCIYNHYRSFRHEKGLWRFYRRVAERDKSMWDQVDNIDRTKLTGEKWEDRLIKAGSIYYFIEETYGVEKLVEFWDRNCEDTYIDNIRPIFESVLGKNIYQLQAEYQLFYDLERLTVPAVAAPDAAVAPPASPKAASEPHRPPRALLEEVVSELCSREFEGRKAGSASCEQAAEYIADLFKQSGLEPLGPYGSYFQKVNLPYAEFLSSSLEVDGGPEYQVYKDYRPVGGGKHSTARGQIVFAGYGLSEKGWDDYARIDATGKIVAVLRGSPDRKYPAFFKNKIVAAAAHGAKGLLIIDSSARDLDDKANAISSSIPALHIAQKIGDIILAKQGLKTRDLTLKFQREKKPNSFETGVDAEMSVSLSYDPQAESSNVLGVLEGGRDVESKDYYVIGAHYDGQGIQEKGTYFPGANDNASGVAGLIGLARVLQPQIEEMDVSFIFAAWTGEEIGLIGSRNFFEQPVVPLECIRGAINLDMIGGNPDIYVRTVDERQVLFTSAKEAARRLGIKVTPQVRKTFGSDADTFAKRKIPTLFFITGNPCMHTERDVPERINWLSIEKVVALAAETMAKGVAPSGKVYAPVVPPGKERPPFGQGTADIDYSAITESRGVDFTGILIHEWNCSKNFIKERLGEPEEEIDRWLNYRATYGLDFVMATDADVLVEIRLNEGCKARLTSGISLSSSKQDVFSVYGRPIAEKPVDNFNIPNREDAVLYESGDDKSMIYYVHKGLIFWFKKEGIVQIVVGRPL